MNALAAYHWLWWRRMCCFPTIGSDACLVLSQLWLAGFEEMRRKRRGGCFELGNYPHLDLLSIHPSLQFYWIELNQLRQLGDMRYEIRLICSPPPLSITELPSSPLSSRWFRQTVGRGLSLNNILKARDSFIWQRGGKTWRSWNRKRLLDSGHLDILPDRTDNSGGRENFTVTCNL